MGLQPIFKQLHCFQLEQNRERHRSIHTAWCKYSLSQLFPVKLDTWTHVDTQGHMDIQTVLLPPANKVTGRKCFPQACVSHSVYRAGGLPSHNAMGRQTPKACTPPLSEGRPPPGMHPSPRHTPFPPDMVNQRVVHILLECILVRYQMHQSLRYFMYFCGAVRDLVIV